MPRHEPLELAPIAASFVPFGAVPAFSFPYIKLLIAGFRHFEILQLLSKLKMYHQKTLNSTTLRVKVSPTSKTLQFYFAALH